MAALETPVACCAPLGAPALDEEEALATAELFKALGDPARVRIVNLLATADAPVCACDLYEPLGLSQPTVSHHLKKLTDAGLLDRERSGREVRYRVTPAPLSEAVSWMADVGGQWDERLAALKRQLG